MAANYKKYLAEKVLNEQDIVTHRALSRALKVHSNLAKRVEPTRLQDLNVLGDIGHDIMQPQPNDPLEYGKQYGMILNRNVKAEHSGPEDVVLDDASEEEREDLFLDTGTRRSNSKRESRKEREEKLRKMMEDVPEDVPELPPARAPERTDTSQSEEVPKAESKEEASAPKGRRRGRRQVMKKTTIKDAEGYLVTKEEPVWESFSEDEAPPPVKRKPAVSVNSKPTSSNKGSQKTGQGNIIARITGFEPVPTIFGPKPMLVQRSAVTETRREPQDPRAWNRSARDPGLSRVLGTFALSFGQISGCPSTGCAAETPLARGDQAGAIAIALLHVLARDMRALPWTAAVLAALVSNGALAGSSHPDDAASLAVACPDYSEYSKLKHPPYSEGPLQLPFQRPVLPCRTFASTFIEKVIEDVTSRMVDKDLAQLFRNAYPNTADTTVRWHVDSSDPRSKILTQYPQSESWQGPQSFIVTGDINAEWLRDSANQVAGYQMLAAKDPKIKTLILGAINTQVEFVLQSPYCNAFQPPPPSGLLHTIPQTQSDIVHPAYEQSVVFECKYELDSLANFLAIGNKFFAETKSTEFVTTRWYRAVLTVLQVIEEQSKPTFDDQGEYVRNTYTFKRLTTLGTETLNLDGVGNPLNNGTGLVRSAFRPSDDATIFGYFIPANAYLSVELKRTALTIKAAGGPDSLIQTLEQRASIVEKGIRDHGIVSHKKFGEVYAFEVDGYGSRLLMDDANLPSLLSLPLLGFVDKDDEVYQNTRKMLLTKTGNPYYLTGTQFHGIGGPHAGLSNAWPMSVLVRARTSDDDEEIMESINMVRNASLLGLIHESVDVDNIRVYTRSWFAWANSVFAQTILELAERKPYLLFGKGASPYKAGE
ncbi:DUF1237 domain-containing protein [Histoplasma capsulatum H143]|uniref:DUF1237 domain-containing protein n=1 Tax=Ajellomyces capsulatus (strain H143) TaxID=544712 RepID=C6HBY4_AJECH|nr:DUF1237 domain-containing protein [Histoplasma capsulatum H143]